MKENIFLCSPRTRLGLSRSKISQACPRIQVEQAGEKPKSATGALEHFLV